MAVANLVINIGANTTGMAAGLGTATNAIDKFYAGIGLRASSLVSPITAITSRVAGIGTAFAGLSRSAVAPLNGLASGLVGIGTAAAGAVAGVAAVGVGLAALGLAAGGAIAALAAGGLDRIDQLTDSAAQLGVSTEALSELRYAANLTGSSAEDLDAALRKLNAGLGDTSEEGGKTGAALARLGLDSKELAKLSPDEAFKKIVDGFGNVTSASEKTRLAMDIFGKGGVSILNTLGAGSKELERLAQEARDLGVSVSQLDAAKVGAAKDALDRAGAAVAGLGNQLAVKLAPFIEVAANLFTDWFRKIGDGGKNVEMVMDAIASGVAKVADFAAPLASAFLRAFAAIAEGASKVASFFGLDGGILSDAATGLRALAEGIDSVKPGDTLLKYYADLKTKANDAAAAIAAGVREQLNSAKVGDTLGDSIGKLTDKLKEQIATFGMSAGEIEIYKLRQQGATEAQLADARALQTQVKGLESAKKAQEDLATFAKGLADKTATPLEKYRSELDKIKKAFDAGLIDEKTANRAALAGAKDAGIGKVEEPKFAGAVDVNSKEGYSAILAATQGRNGGGLEKTAQEQLEAQRAGNGLIGRLIAAVQGQGQGQTTIEFA